MNKKVTRLIFVLILLMSMCLGAHAQNTGFVGSWRLMAFEGEGVSLAAEDLEVSFVLIFGEDGKLEVGEDDDDLSDLEWRMQDGAAVFGEAGEVFTCVLDGDTLKMTSEYGTMIFGREPADTSEPNQTPFLTDGMTWHTPPSAWLDAFFSQAKMVDTVFDDSFFMNHYPDHSEAAQYGYGMNVGGFMRIELFCDLDGAIDLCTLIIDLSHSNVSIDQVRDVIQVIALASDPRATAGQIQEMLDSLCPDLPAAFSGERELDEETLLNGIRYILFTDHEDREAYFLAIPEPEAAKME